MAKILEIHGHKLEFEKNEGKAIIELYFGDEPTESYLIDIFSVDEVEYIALVDSESSQLYILEYMVDDENSENISLNPLGDEEKLDEIYHLFNHYWDLEAIDEIVNEYMQDLEESDMNE